MASVDANYRGDIRAQLAKSRQRGKSELYFCNATITEDVVEAIIEEMKRVDTHVSRLRFFFSEGVPPLLAPEIVGKMKKISIYGVDDDSNGVVATLGAGLVACGSLENLAISVSAQTDDAESLATAWTAFAAGLTACKGLTHLLLSNGKVGPLPSSCCDPVVGSIASSLDDHQIQNLVLQKWEISSTCMKHIISIFISTRTLHTLCLLSCVIDGTDGISFADMIPYASDTVKVLRLDSSRFIGESAGLVSTALNNALVDDDRRVGMSSVEQFDVMNTTPCIEIEHKHFFLALNRIGQFRGSGKNDLSKERLMETLIRLQAANAYGGDGFHWRYDLSLVYYVLRYKPCWS